MFLGLYQEYLATHVFNITSVCTAGFNNTKTYPIISVEMTHSGIQQKSFHISREIMRSHTGAAAGALAAGCISLVRIGPPALPWRGRGREKEGERERDSATTLSGSQHD